ncbi:MAG TPA: TonB-dependent receptor plug domain-containing protein, partial [Sphingomonas sp.]|nr:TonB-dependent receptor plug domain-containing protein [Sphingomonas sp.]
MLNSNNRIVGATLRAGFLLGASAAALGIAAPALAQTSQDVPPESGAAPAEEPGSDEAIVVTGLRASIASAQSIKQNSDQFVDSITAIDIGKLPDVNVAEALQRVSGIQITRNRGEGSSIAIRGLTQVRTEMNGRDSFSANNGRALSFEDVPSELLAGVDVFKNPSAQMIEGGIGGLVNLRTRMPFDQSGNLYSLTLGTNYYDLIDELKLNISGLVSQRWETGIGEVGVLLSASYFEGAFRTDTVTIEPFWDRTDIPGFTGQTRSVAAGAGVSTTWGERSREGYYGALQWRPAHNLEFYATGFQSRYYIATPNFSYFGFGPSGSGGSLTPVDGSFAFDEDGTMERGSFLNIPVNNNSGHPLQWTTTTDLAGGFKWDVN